MKSKESRPYLGFLKEYAFKKKLLPSYILTIATIVLTAGVSLVRPELQGKVIDDLGNPHSTSLSAFMLLLVVFLGMLLLNYLMNYVQRYIVAVISEEIAADMRQKVEDKLSTVSVNFFEKIKLSDILLKVDKDVSAVKQCGITSIITLVSNIVILVVVPPYMFSIHKGIAVSNIILLVSVPFISRILGKLIQETSGQVLEGYNSITNVLTKEPNITKALDGVDFSVEKGEFVAIVGTSGSGKSTLLNMLGGLDIPTSGEIKIQGKKLSDLNDEQLTIFRRRNIGFIFQNYNLLPMLNVYENIVLPIELDGQEVDQVFLNEIINMLGLKEKLKSMPNMLSGGQQQRVAIARALITKPAIILADEPTGNLDSKTSQDVLELIQSTSRKFEQSVVMITHNEHIADLAERIVRIEDGKFLKIGVGEDEKTRG